MTGRHRNLVPISPALVLKLVRDKVAATRADLIDYLRRGRWFLPESALRHELDLALDGLLAAGLLRDDSLVLEATELTDRITKALKISLTDLSEWDESSVIAHPAFSSPVPNPEPAAVFMVMPFTTALEPVYQDHIRRVCDELTLSLARADDFYSSQSIVAGIWSAIYFSTLVVADCTGRNPNVFYEIGIAHTIGRPTILITQSIDDVPFDLRHLRCLPYTFTPRGMKDFELALARALRAELANKVRRA